MKSLEEVNLTPEQRQILRSIHMQARAMEALNNTGCAHSLIEELSDGVLAPSYIREKLNGLFYYDPMWSYEYRDAGEES